MTTTHFITKDRILGAAEELFAQHGFAGTSLRQVTSRADVNIAAVNYHFGSKENLVNEVFRRRMDEMSEQRLAQLRQAQDEQPGDLEADPGRLHRAGPGPDPGPARRSAFVRVLARAYAEKNDRLRKFLSDNYGHVLREFAKAIARLPAGSGQGRAVLAHGLHRRRTHLCHGRFRPDQASRRRVREDPLRASAAETPDPLRRRRPARRLTDLDRRLRLTPAIPHGVITCHNFASARWPCSAPA